MIHVRAIAAVVLLSICAPIPAGAQPVASENELKAAYLVNFARFVGWPAGVGGNEFTICVLEAEPLAAAVQASLKGLVVQNLPVALRRIVLAEEARACRMLFIGASAAPRLPAILTELAAAPVLTVSDMPQFVGRGGMIQFVHEGERVRFAVDLAPAQLAGLMLSANLLRVATVVRPGVRAQ